MAPIRSPQHSAGVCSNNSTCKICNITDTSQNKAKLICCYCNRKFHLTCAGVSIQFYESYIVPKKMDWHCYMCKDDSKNMDSLNTISNLLKTASTEIDKIIDYNNSRRKNLIVSGIPKDENTNVETLVCSLPDLIGFNKQYWLDNCFKLDRKQSHNATNLEKILSKSTTEIRIDDFMKSYLNYTRKKKPIPASIELSGENRIYVKKNLSEDLSMNIKEAILMQEKCTLKKVHGHSCHVVVSKRKVLWFINN